MCGFMCHTLNLVADVAITYELYTIIVALQYLTGQLSRTLN